MIKVIKKFEVDTQGEFKHMLTSEQLTAFSIWLVEAINNRDAKALYFDDVRFAWRERVPEFAMAPANVDLDLNERIHIRAQQHGMDLLHARNLVDVIEELADKEELLDDTYPGFGNHPSEGHQAGRYQVTVFNDDKLLGYVDTHNGKSILPVALKLREDTKGYDIDLSDKVDRPWYTFK